MAIIIGVGHAQGLDGREAASQATHRALNQVGRNPIALGMVITSHHHPIQPVVNGITALLGEAPLIGMSTTAEITSQGIFHHSVIVILFSGGNLTAKANFWPDFATNPSIAGQRLEQSLRLEDSQGTLFVFAEGFSGDANQVLEALSTGSYHVAGGLSSGSFKNLVSYQIGGHQAGSDGLAGATLSGDYSVGIGQAHGWQPVGKYFQITRVDVNHIHSLDELSAAEAYARQFNFPVEAWQSPPLNELVRLYPIGIELPETGAFVVRSALRMEADGSMRMHTAIPDGLNAHLLLGSKESCLTAARIAAQQALDSLGSTRPIFGLILADIAWQMMFESQPGSEINAIRQVLGADVPLAGGYTYSQFTNAPGGTTPPELLNQHLQIVLFSE